MAGSSHSSSSLFDSRERRGVDGRTKWQERQGRGPWRSDSSVPFTHSLSYCNSFLICCWFRICDLMCMLLSISNCSILTVLIVVFSDLRYGDWWLGGIIGAHKLQAPKDCKPWEEDMTLCFHLIPGPGPEIFCKLGFYSLAVLRSQN